MRWPGICFTLGLLAYLGGAKECCLPAWENVMCKMFSDFSLLLPVSHNWRCLADRHIDEMY